MRKKGPLVVQSDSSILLETDHPDYERARDALSRFAELEKSPEHVHTYRITPLSIWNACAARTGSSEILKYLQEFSRYDIPQNVTFNIEDLVSRYGIFHLKKQGGVLQLYAKKPEIFNEICHQKNISKFFAGEPGESSVSIQAHDRGNLKLALVDLGFPVDDEAGYVEGSPLSFRLRETALSGQPFDFRDYQRESVDIFHAGGSNRGGSGVIVLPYGAGKTIVGIGVLHRLQKSALILTANITALRQWISELLDKTTLTSEDIGEYSGQKREIRSVTIATYQILIYRKRKGMKFPHLHLFEAKNWGLIVYDEVHLLPAPVFRITADIQARRRLGLTATLIREDGKEKEVFSLIGPKKYDVPWKVLEKQGWIAKAECFEVKIPLSDSLRLEYITSGKRTKYRLAAENPAKMDLIGKILSHHPTDSILIIGQYINQLRMIQKKLGVPIITGQTPNGTRGKLYEDFRAGRSRILIVSKVANFAIDLPDANVAIQISGSFGSRQEEAQRLGRILRPKEENTAFFYSLVSRDTSEQIFSAKRQLFLTEQGYQYHVYNLENFEKKYIKKPSVSGDSQS